MSPVLKRNREKIDHTLEEPEGRRGLEGGGWWFLVIFEKVVFLFFLIRGGGGGGGDFCESESEWLWNVKLRLFYSFFLYFCFCLLFRPFSLGMTSMIPWIPIDNPPWAFHTKLVESKESGKRLRKSVSNVASSVRDSETFLWQDVRRGL